MVDVDSFGQLITSRNAVVPLARTDLLQGTAEEVFTDSNFVGSNQNAGTYATQTLGAGAVVAAGITSENDTTWAYIRSAGEIKLALPVSGINGGHNLPGTLPYPKALVSGDQCMVLSSAVADRDVSLSVACTNGDYHIFEITPAASGEHELLSILTGLSVGQTLSGRTVSHAFSMGGNNSANFSSPIYFVDGSGVPIASVTPNDPAVDSGTFQPCRAQIALNTRCVFRTDA